MSLATSTSTAVYTKEEAVLKAMRTLEGVRRPKDKSASKDKRNVLGAISRPAPSPPRPRSLDSQVEVTESKRKDEQRRSLGIDRTLMDVVEESPVRKTTFEVEGSESSLLFHSFQRANWLMTGSDVHLKIAESARPQSPARADISQTTSPARQPTTPTRSSPSRKPTPFSIGTPTKSPLRNAVIVFASTGNSPQRPPSMASPPRPRLATKPTDVIATGRPFPADTAGSEEALPFPVVSPTTTATTTNSNDRNALAFPVELPTDGRQSPMTELRERIMSDDRKSQS